MIIKSFKKYRIFDSINAFSFSENLENDINLISQMGNQALRLLIENIDYEVNGNLNKISNELEYKPVVLDFKFNYKFYKQFFIDSFNSNFKSFPLLILQYNKKNYMMSSELFESYIEMTYNSFIIIENFSNGKYNFLNFGVEKSVSLSEDGSETDDRITSLPPIFSLSISLPSRPGSLCSPEVLELEADPIKIK